MYNKRILMKMNREDSAVKRPFAPMAALLTALLISACLLPRPAKADNTPAPAATTTAAATDAQGQSTTGTLLACIGGALTGGAYVMIRRLSGSRGKSYMSKKKK